MTLNPLPWPLADEMSTIKNQLIDTLGLIRLLGRPVPPMAIVRAKSMRNLLDLIIKEGEQNVESTNNQGDRI